MADPALALQKALYQALTAALSCPVYDAVPQGAARPYVAFDGESVSPDDPLSSRRDTRHLYLSVWSDYAGAKQVKEIVSVIDGALHNKRLALDTGRMVVARLTRKQVIKSVEDETYQGAVTVRVITEH